MKHLKQFNESVGMYNYILATEFIDKELKIGQPSKQMVVYFNLAGLLPAERETVMDSIESVNVGYDPYSKFNTIIHLDISEMDDEAKFIFHRYKDKIRVKQNVIPSSSNVSTSLANTATIVTGSRNFDPYRPYKRYTTEPIGPPAEKIKVTRELKKFRSK